MSLVAARTDAAHTATVETHVSTLFFVGDRAYKLKKPVRFGFLDFSTPEAREEACRREVELNRRFAPDVYLGVSTVLDPSGSPCDHLVVMRRMPVDRRLAALAHEGADIADIIRLVARKMAAVHAAAPSSAEIARAGARLMIQAGWRDNVDEMAPFVGRILPAATLARVAALAARYLVGRAPLFRSRIEAGKIRDGHGDLLAADIFCLDDGPRILDCIEFDDALRHGDVVADIAFLAMDLERLGRPEEGERLFAAYREYAGESFPASLAHNYIASRALVRSKVACLRAAQGEPGAGLEAVRLLGIAREHLERGAVTLTLIGGLPGTGKSTIAARVALARGDALLRSDEVRKDLAGMSHRRHDGSRFEDGIYAPAMTAATYRVMLDRARAMLSMGSSVVLDASWASSAARDEAAAVAIRTSSDLVEIRLEAPGDVAAARLATRATSRDEVSDATPEIARSLAGRFTPWPSAHHLDATGAEGDTVASALEVIERRMPASTGRSLAHSS